MKGPLARSLGALRLIFFFQTRVLVAADVRREGDREADVVSGAGNRRGMRAGEGTVRVQSRVHVSRGLDVDDVEQVTAAAEVPDGPLDRVLGLLRAVDGDHEVALVLVVARIRGVERGVGSAKKCEG